MKREKNTPSTIGINSAMNNLNQNPNQNRRKQRLGLNLSLCLNLILILTLTITLPQQLKSQDLDFAQYYNNPTYYNPANVGLSQGLKVRLNYKKQWTGLSGNYRTYNFSADIAERSLPGAGGIGIIANQSVEGVGMLKTNTFGFLPSVRIPVARNMIFQLGALASIVTQSLNWDNLVFEDQLDPRWGNIGPSTFAGAARDKVSFPDFSFGGIFQWQGMDVDGKLGVAVHHITQPNQSFFDVDAKLPRKYVYNLDFIINVGQEQGYYQKKEGFKLNPGVMVQHQQNMFLYTLGTNLYMQHVYLGLWYKNQTLEYDEFSSFDVMVGLNIPFTQQYRMKLMYSYEMNINARQNFTGPSHEISLIFELDDIGLINKDKNSFMAPRSRSFSPVECSPF
jgi:type IX secretion system PorP/SprF family membrane protein